MRGGPREQGVCSIDVDFGGEYEVDGSSRCQNVAGAYFCGRMEEEREYLDRKRLTAELVQLSWSEPRWNGRERTFG